MKNTKPVNVHLPLEVHQRLKEQAAENVRSLTAHCIYILTQASNGTPAAVISAPVSSTYQRQTAEEAANKTLAREKAKEDLRRHKEATKRAEVMSKAPLLTQRKKYLENPDMWEIDYPGLPVPIVPEGLDESEVEAMRRAAHVYEDVGHDPEGWSYDLGLRKDKEHFRDKRVFAHTEYKTGRVLKHEWVAQEISPIDGYPILVTKEKQIAAPTPTTQNHYTPKSAEQLQQETMEWIRKLESGEIQ